MKRRFGMRILMICFSGTGNTRAIAEILRNEFISNDAEYTLIPMEHITQGLSKPDYDN
jgi:flavodoxin